MTDEYTCAMCGETHLKGHSDEEAEAELGEVFPVFAVDADLLAIKETRESIDYISWYIAEVERLRNIINKAPILIGDFHYSEVGDG